MTACAQQRRFVLSWPSYYLGLNCCCEVIPWYVAARKSASVFLAAPVETGEAHGWALHALAPQFASSQEF